MTTPHTSGDSGAAPTISDERVSNLLDEVRDELTNSTALQDHQAMRFFGPLLDVLTDYKRLRSASAAPVEGVAWQPITTRPTDGTVVLFCDERGNRWTDCSGMSEPYPECGYWPTHWQPLPKAPAAESPTGEKAEASATREGDLVARLETVREVLVERDLNFSACIVDEAISALRTDTAPTCGVTEDAARFRWCQDNPHAAQAMFWNHSSRRDRAKAIDAAMSSKGERG